MTNQRDQQGGTIVCIRCGKPRIQSAYRCLICCRPVRVTGQADGFAPVHIECATGGPPPPQCECEQTADS